MPKKRKDEIGVRVTVNYERGDSQSPEAAITVDGKCVYHLERMTDDCWWMGLYGDKEVRISLHSDSPIRAIVDDGTQQRWLDRAAKRKRVRR